MAERKLEFLSQFSLVNFLKVKGVPAIRTWTDGDLKEAVSKSRSVRDVVRRLGLIVAGGSCKAIKKAIQKQELSTDHFIKFKPKSKEDPVRRSPASAFMVGSTATKNTIKRLLRRHLLIPYQCRCGLIDQWEGKKLVLQLEHKNGNTHDNRLENLEWLCANCHSQTSTYAGRNRNPDSWKDGKKILGADYSEMASAPGFSKRKVDFQDVRAFYSVCNNLRLTAKNFGISHQSVMHILERLTIDEVELEEMSALKRWFQKRELMP